MAKVILMQVKKERPIQKILPDLKDISSAPGVYLMKDAAGTVIYVGKAANLKKRLASYFGKKGRLDHKTSVLVSKINSFETILTRNEKEALILESNLIKKYRPRYNVVLKDDKRYPSLRIDPRLKYPNLTMVRKIKKDGALYFGPYASAKAVRQTLRFIHKTFKLRKCNDKLFLHRTRPCLNYQMSLCMGPCCMEIDHKAYRETVKEVIAFLKGQTQALISKIRKQMLAAAKRQAFEQAAELRDKLFALEKTLEKQVTIINDFKDRDIIALAEDGPWTVMTVFRVRSGFLLGQSHFQMENAIGDAGDKMSVFIRQYYSTRDRLPNEVLLSHWPEDARLLSAHFNSSVGRKARFVLPRKADKRRLVEMALANARDKVKQLRQGDQARHELLRHLQKKLKMDRLPLRIECFDNSHISGSQMVAAMAVFVNGLPARDEFRKFKLEMEGGDDYQAMALVLERRFKKKNNERKLPDLIMIDGGKGQLNVALKVLDELGLNGCFQVIGIAKMDHASSGADKIYLPGRVNPLVFNPQDKMLLFMQQVRDQAHRLAISYQRARHRRHGLESALDRIPGVGPKRKTTLLQAFGDLKKIRAATLAELSALPGINKNLARTILEVLNSPEQ